MSIFSKTKTVLSWLVAALVMIASAIFGVLWFRKKSISALSSESTKPETDSGNAAAAGEVLIQKIELAGDKETAKVEAEHADATKALEQRVETEANGLAHDPNSLAEELKRHARS